MIDVTDEILWRFAIAEKPEKTESSKTYDVSELNLGDRNTSHTLILELVGTEKRVLDVGGATGYVAKVLTRSGCEVVGVELDPEAAKKAEEHCEKVIVGNVETMDLDAELGRDSFDVIIFGDVLEHLRDPPATLARLKPFLRQEGYVVASIPNIAHGSVRLALMQGKFEYRSLGLLDDTHLHFFTRDSVEELFQEAGFMVGELRRTTAGIFETEIEFDREAVTEEMLAEVQRDPDSETYQFVLSAHPSSYAGTYSKLANRVRLLEEDIARRDEIIHELNRKLAPQEELTRQLENHTRLLAEREQEASRLRKRVADNEQVLGMLTGRAAIMLSSALGRLRRSGG